MTRETEHTDAVILALRQKYQEKQSEHFPVGWEILIGTDIVPLYQETLFDGACSIMLPESMTDMDMVECMVRYQSSRRPEIVKTDMDREASMTFSLLPLTDEEKTDSVSGQLMKIRSDMKKVWRQNIFYDMGEVAADKIPVAWMDFRAYCLDGNLYGMLFMFRMEGQAVLGNFHCSFPKYDIWKPVILKLLTTIQVDNTPG